MKQVRDSLLGPPTSTDNPYSESGKRMQSPRALVALAILGVVTVGGLAFLGGRMSLQEAPSETPPKIVAEPTRKIANNPTKPNANLVPEKVALTEKELNNTLRFGEPKECVAEGTLGKLYAKLDKATEAPGTPLSVKLDEFENPMSVFSEENTDADGARVASAYVRFPEQAVWNSLKLSRAKVNIYAPPESDSSYTRSLTFLNTPVQVQTALNRMGFAVPLSPRYSELHDEGCGGAMQIEAVPGGASLSCGWGC